MSKIGFFTAVSFDNQSKSCLQGLQEKADDYFYLSGKKACVIPGHAQNGSKGAVLTQFPSSLLITILKIISYLTVIIPLFMLIAKAVLRSTQNFYIIDPKQKLEEGLNISQSTIAKIRELMPKICGCQNDAEIMWHASGNNLVFSLASAPNLIFKTAPPGRGVLRAGRALSAQQISDQRFANMVKAKEVCLAHQLGLLVIPHAKKFVVDGRVFIAEERIDIQHNESAQEDLYRKLPGLDQTAKQLATFIAKTGFNDVEWRNIPIVDDAPLFQGPRRVALVDLEEMESAADGIFGGAFGRRGLIRCLSSEKQIDIALAETRRQGVVDRWTSRAQVKARRMKEIQSDQQLYQFYKKNGILEDARKPIQVRDLTSLGLDLNEQGEMRIGRRLKTGTSNDPWGLEWETAPVTMKKAVVDVIDAINNAITATPKDASLKGKRYIRLDHNSDKSEQLFLKEYDRLGCKEDGFVSDKELNQRWLKRIIDALVAERHVFKLDKQNAYGYFIQA